jgi:hypothetical protein
MSIIYLLSLKAIERCPGGRHTPKPTEPILRKKVVAHECVRGVSQAG